MGCRSCERRLSAFIDGALDEAEARAVAEHLRGCGACRAMRDELAALVGCLRGGTDGESRPVARQEGPPPELWTRIESELRERRAQRSSPKRARRWPLFFAPALGALGLLASVGMANWLHGRMTALAQVGEDAALLAEAGTAIAQVDGRYQQATEELDALAPSDRLLQPDFVDEVPFVESVRQAWARPDLDTADQVYARYRDELAAMGERLTPGVASNDHLGVRATQ